MKRTTTLALLVLTCLTAMPSIAQARYRDGMNLYEYVRSQPVDGRDPTGEITWLTKNRDVKAAFTRVYATRLGAELIDCIEALEKAKNVMVIMTITQARDHASNAGSRIYTDKLPIRYADDKREHVHYFKVKIGKKVEELNLSVAPIQKFQTGRAKGYIMLEMNPLFSATTFGVAYGDRTWDFRLGVPLHETMFHEMSHVRQMLEGKDFNTPKVAKVPGKDKLNKQQLAAWKARWQRDAEYEAVMRTNSFRLETGDFRLRTRYLFTKDQQDASMIQMGSMEDAWRRRSITLMEWPRYWEEEEKKGKTLKKYWYPNADKPDILGKLWMRWRQEFVNEYATFRIQGSESVLVPISNRSYQILGPNPWRHGDKPIPQLPSRTERGLPPLQKP